MGQANRIGSIAECYAHALTIEREAIERYEEFAELLEEKGNDNVANLFRQLARLESDHADALAFKTRGMQLPKLERWQYSWLDDGPPETVSHELVYHLMTPYDALKIALTAEERTKAFFDHLRVTARDPELHSLAAEMAHDEDAHIAWIMKELARTPKPVVVDDSLVGLFPG